MRTLWLLCLVAALDAAPGAAQGQRVRVEWRKDGAERAAFVVHTFRYSADAYTQTKPAIELLTPQGSLFVPFSKIGSMEFVACEGRGASHEQAARWDVVVLLGSGAKRAGAVDLRYLLGTDEEGLEWRLWMGHPCTRDAKALHRLVFSP